LKPVRRSLGAGGDYWGLSTSPLRSLEEQVTGRTKKYGRWLLTPTAVFFCAHFL